MSEASRFGRYELVRRLAVGGMAEVFLARSHGAEGFSRPLVIKRMLPALAQDKRIVQMFLDEARLGARLSHPNIVQVLDLGEANGEFYIAMEHVDGTDLSTLLAHGDEQGQRLSIPLGAYVLACVAEGLHHAHTAVDPESGAPLNVVHRDVSPHNVLLSRHGDVKVTDFGVAKNAAQVARTETRSEERV